MARTILHEHLTPRCLWADAISTACYISNPIFLLLILHFTPLELRFGRKPSVYHLRPFGCKCFVNMEILISLSLAPLMAFCLDTPLMADLTEFITLKLIPLLSHVM
jgi:hypothetical protein